MPTTLRVMTYNIHHGTDARGRPSLSRIIETIARLAPDVAVLQEVDRFWQRSGQVDQPALLAQALGMRAAYAPALTRSPRTPGSPGQEYGNLLLARLPLDGVRRVMLPGAPGHEPRSLVHARVEIAGNPVVVAGVHLDHSSRRLRARQARAVLSELARVNAPVVLGGDMNGGRLSTPVRILATGLSDLWPLCGIGRGSTFTGDLWHPVPSRIDYLLTSGLRGVQAHVRRERRPPSDHLPLLAQVSLP